jgi:hypothetical protein
MHDGLLWTPLESPGKSGAFFDSLCSAPVGANGVEVTHRLASALTERNPIW